jgi:hypothetical protein
VGLPAGSPAALPPRPAATIRKIANQGCMVSKLLQKSISDFKSISNKLDFHFETIDMIDQINIKSAVITLRELYVKIMQRVDPDNTIISLNCSRTSSAVDRSHLVSVLEKFLLALLEFAYSIVLSPEVCATRIRLLLFSAC